MLFGIKKPKSILNTKVKVGDTVLVMGHRGKVSEIQWLTNEARHQFLIDFGKNGKGRVYDSDIDKSWVPLKECN